MKRRKQCILAVLLAAAVCLTGCRAADSVKSGIRQILIDRQAERYAAQFEQLSADEVEEARQSVTSEDYAYSQLSGEEQEIYLELLFILSSYREEVRVTSMDPDQVDRVYKAVLMDHPELFYTNGYTITEHAIDGKTEFYTFSGQYAYEREEMEAKREQAEQSARRILAGISDTASDYEKEKYIYDYIVQNTVYDEEAPDNQNMLSVLLNNASVCQGYAYATQYLLKQAGIPCTTVTGNARNQDGNLVAHAWNLVRLDGEYYYVDTTWGDPVTGPEAEQLQIMQGGYVNYDYLNLTTAQMEKDHEPLCPVSLPECTATACNYYRKEGLFYETYDTELLRERIEQAREAGEGYLMMKFPDETVYGEYMDRLFEGQEIFRVVTSAKSISYTADPESCLLILYLK